MFADAPGTGQCAGQCPGGTDIDASRTDAADHDDQSDCQNCVPGKARAFGAATPCEACTTVGNYCGPGAIADDTLCPAGS